MPNKYCTNANISSATISRICYTLIFISYFSLSLANFITQEPLLQIVATALGLLALFLESKRINRERVKIYVLAGMLYTFTLISSLVLSREATNLFAVLNILSNTGIALILLSGKISALGGYIPFYGLTAFFMIRIVNGVVPDFALKYSSFNGISVLMLVACISLYIIKNINSRKIDLVYAVVAVIISIWAIGRSGIISSFVLLFGLLLIKLKSKPKYFYIVALLSVIAFLVVIKCSEYISQYINIQNAIDYALNKESLTSNRAEIWGNYFNNLDVVSIIFGTDAYKDPYVSDWYHNYHSSYVNLHALAGLMGLVIMGLILITLGRLLKHHRIFFVLFLAISLRMSTDICNFFTLFDFIPFFFIFYSITYSQECIKNRSLRLVSN